MIVYVESNFVLELALRQEEHEACQQILRGAETGRIQLVVPAFSLAEPYETWHRRAREREDLRDRLESELRQLFRSEHYAQVLEGSTRITGLLTRSLDEDKKRVDGVCRRLTSVATVVSLDDQAVGRSLDVQETLDLSPQDAFVYASVVAHLRTTPPDEPKIFVTRDPDDFATPEVEDHLEEFGASLLPSFSDAAGHLEATLDGI